MWGNGEFFHASVKKLNIHLQLPLLVTCGRAPSDFSTAVHLWKVLENIRHNRLHVSSKLIGPGVPQISQWWAAGASLPRRPCRKKQNSFFFFKDFYLFIFREKGREGERDGEKYQCVVASHAPPLGTWPTTQACALTGNRTGDPLVRRLTLNPLSHTIQGGRILSEWIKFNRKY